MLLLQESGQTHEETVGSVGDAKAQQSLEAVSGRRLGVALRSPS
jgi:hypothetical protein